MPNNPDSTTISAHGYQVLIADGELDQGILHLDFRISASGEELGLVQLVGLDTMILDQLAFGDFSAGTSLGRRTDGGTPWEAQEFTPGGTNKSLSIEIPKENFASVYPNPARDILYITLPDTFEGALEIQVVNALGQVVLSEKSSDIVPGQLVSMDVSALEAGVYFLKLRSGSLTSVKRIVIAH